MTEAEYLEKKAAFEKRLDEARTKLAEAIDTKGESLADPDTEWDLLHDAIYDLEAEIEGLEDDWETRDWTSSEWREWNLMQRNVD